MHRCLLSILAFAILLQQPALAEESQFKSFEIPGIFQIHYPSRFTVVSESAERDVLEYAKTLVAKTGNEVLPPWEKLRMVFTAHDGEGSNYVHLGLMLMPAELSQEQVRSLGPDFLVNFKDLACPQLRTAIESDGSKVLGDFKVSKEHLANGIISVKVTCFYETRNSELRSNTKHYIYTKGHTLVLGITFGVDYLKSHSVELNELLASFKPEGD